MLPVDTSLWEKYSDLDRLVRTTAWCRRFLHNSLKKGDIREARLTSAELEDALNLLLHLSQQLSYAQELNQLQKGQPVANSSSLLQLRPLLGEEGLIRLGGGGWRMLNLPLRLPTPLSWTRVLNYKTFSRPSAFSV